jgi:AcrR family transcriptional regulator
VPKTEPTTQARADDRVRRAKGHAQRDRIVTAAVELLAAKGFRGTTIAQLAEQVGTTHTNLIYYFGSKERLLLEVVAERERQEGAGYYAALESDSWSTPAFVGVAQLIAENALFTRLYVVLAAENLDPGDPLHEFFVERYKRARAFVESALRADQDQGRIRSSVDVEQMSREIVATLMGLEIQWLMDSDGIDFLATAGAYAEGLRERMRPE